MELTIAYYIQQTNFLSLSKLFNPMDKLMIFLRILHIFFAVFWGGTVFYMALFVLPASKAIPEGGKFMMQLGKTNGMPIVLMLSPTFTVIGGIWLLWKQSAGFSHGYMSSAMGQTFSIGGTAAILAYLVGFIINMPAGM